MNSLLIYLYQSSLSLTFLFVIYWLFLRKDTFFQVNRLFIINMGLFSLLIPLMPFEWPIQEALSEWVVYLEPVLITPEKVEQSALGHMNLFEIGTVVYFTGVIIFTLRFFIQLLQLVRIVGRSGIRKVNGLKVVYVDRGFAPFSFFNMVFINEKGMPHKDLETILAHERVHIRQGHTFDLIFAEVMIILHWFNPVAWLIARELKTVHEYLADEGVIRNGVASTEYQQMILNETLGIQVNNLTNNFNVTLLKKRIVMMKKSRTANWMAGKFLAAFPVIVFIMFLLSAKAEPVLLNQPVAFPDLKSDTVVKKAQSGKKTAKWDVFMVVENQPTFPGGQTAMQHFLQENIKYPEEAIKKGIKGTVFIKFIVMKDGSVTDFRILRGIGGGCDEEALRVVKLMPDWIPGSHKGEPVNVQFSLPVKFTLSYDKNNEKSE